MGERSKEIGLWISYRNYEKVMRGNKDKKKNWGLKRNVDED